MLSDYVALKRDDILRDTRSATQGTETQGYRTLVQSA
jgi:hypothetical protein